MKKCVEQPPPRLPGARLPGMLALPPVAAALRLVFFLSGAAALVFEVLWFRLAGLTFGNSVWASSLVLTSFMAGLGLGNALAAAYGPRLRRPVRAYAALEAAIGVTGLALVCVFPLFSELLAPLFRPLFERPWLLNPLRLGASFLLLLVPSTAMGATLPVLVRALSQRESDFGALLGQLYGWNTLGAVVGALSGEAFVIESLGVRGSGLAAAGLNGIAALTALAVAMRLEERDPPPEASAGPLSAASRRLLLAAFLCGAILLALEVVWFRFLLLFVHGTSWTFSAMLGVVLLGIAAGGLAASAWQRRDRAAHRALPLLALLAGALGSACYLALEPAVAPHAARLVLDSLTILRLSAQLMLPVSLVSGILFTFLGRALETHVSARTRVTGLLTLANTMGGAVGSLLGGFVLLPRLGIETSLWLLALAYGGVALLAYETDHAPRRRADWVALAACGALFVALIAAFPFGFMQRRFLPKVLARFTSDGSRVVLVREGLTESIAYYRRDFLGEPFAYRLVTNGFSMSTTTGTARRYMKLYVYLPVALNPDIKRALLISYGVGSTAKALTDTRGLESIDVVDISPDILELSRIPYPVPGTNPLADPRVRVHVEDGRYFLQTSGRLFDLITAEPPPPKNAGIVNLYSREYFSLVKRRLAPRGIVSYWLPVPELETGDTKAIIKGFCLEFRDCTLWTASSLNFMLMGTREGRALRDETAFRRQWEDPTVGPEMRALGWEVPEQVGATFLGDAAFLAKLTDGAEPLTDDHPYRLSGRLPLQAAPAYFELMDVRSTRERFEQSQWIRDHWAPGLRERTLPFFELQGFMNEWLVSWRAPTSHVRRTLAGSDLRSLPAFLMGSSPDEQRILDGRRHDLYQAARQDSMVPRHWAVRAMVDRDYVRAASLFLLARPAERPNRPSQLIDFGILALVLGGERQKALALIEDQRVRAGIALDDPAFWAQVQDAFGLDPPARRSAN